MSGNAPGTDAREVRLARSGTLHQFEDARAGVLEWHIEVGQELALGHQRNDFVHVWIRIDVMQAHPQVPGGSPKFAQGTHEFGHARFQRAALPEAGSMPGVHAVGAGVLRDDQDFLDPGIHQVLRLLHHLAYRPAREVSAQRRNDAEGAAVIAAFRNLEIGIMRGCESHALRRHQVGVGIVRPGQVRVHRLHHFVGRVRTGHRQHLGMRLAHDVALGA
jgi:hypothetical protein